VFETRWRCGIWQYLADRAPLTRQTHPTVQESAMRVNSKRLRCNNTRKSDEDPILVVRRNRKIAANNGNRNHDRNLIVAHATRIMSPEEVKAWAQVGGRPICLKEPYGCVAEDHIRSRFEIPSDKKLGNFQEFQTESGWKQAIVISVTGLLPAASVTAHEYVRV
jgi:hypothetical protein